MLRIYIAEAARDDQRPITEALRRAFPSNPPPSSWIIVTGLSLPEWLIEIEAEAGAALVAGPQSATFHCSRESLAG